MVVIANERCGVLVCPLRMPLLGHTEKGISVRDKDDQGLNHLTALDFSRVLQHPAGNLRTYLLQHNSSFLEVMTAATQVLYNQDILTEIFELFSFEHEPERKKVVDDQRDLARFARVCHVFTEPALDVLWRRLYRPIPLLRLLRPSVLRNHIRARHVYVIPSGEVLPHVWARFPQYARRVRILTYMCLGCIDASVWAALLRQNNGEPLLPRLHTLEWYGASTNDKSFQYFISKPLRNLTMHMRIKVEPIYDYSEMNISPTVAQPISEAAPLLETLHVEDYLRRPLEFLTPFTRLTALREITFDDDVEVTPLEALSAMKNLASLSVKVSSYSASVQHLPRPGGFHAMQKLKIGSDSSAIAMVLRATAPNRLQSLFIVDCEKRNQEPILPYLQLLSKFASLRSLVLEVDRSRFSQAVQFTELANGLSSLQSIESFTMVFFGKPPFSSDADLSVLASGLRQLTAFSVFYDTTLDGFISSTQVLIDILSFCPHLAKLYLPVPDLSPVGLVPIEDTHLRFPSLMKFDVGFVEGDVPEGESKERLTRALIRVCPNAELTFGLSEDTLDRDGKERLVKIKRNREYLRERW